MSEKTEAEGKLDQLKGKVKEGVGEITGNRKDEAEGKGEQIKGKGKEEVGKV